MRKKLLPFLVFAFLLVSQLLLAQNKTITGTITDVSDGMPLPGATVVVKGTNVGTSTDFDGNFSLDNVPNDGALIISMIGYTTTEFNISGKTTLNVSLSIDAQQLDEVVVTSLGLTRERKSLGYSVTELDGGSVSLVKESNVASSLAGKVAGVVVSKSTSGVGGGTRVVIRGNNSITGNNQPLYVVDGVPIDNSALSTSNGSEYSVPDLGNGISDINPDDIESMSILKGPNAAALYGSRASNGVIIITTKSGRKTKGLGISYTTSATFENPLVLPEYQNEYGRGNNGNFPQIDTSADLATQVNTVRGNSSWGPRFDGSERLAYNGEMRPYVAQPNNVKDFFETGSSFVNTIALNAGSEKASVFFSYTNSDLESILPNSKVKRNNFNLRGTANLSDKLSLDAKITYFIQNAQNRPTQGTEGVVAYLWPLARNVAINDLKNYQDINNPIDPNDPYRVIAPTSSGGNPYWMLYNDYNGDKRTRVTGFAKLNYQFTDWLSVFARVGTDAIKQDTEAYEATGHHFYPDGQIRFTKNDRTETNYDFLLMFNKDIGNSFNLSANAGGNMRHSTYINSGTNGYDFKIPGRYFLDNTDGSQLTATQSDNIEKRVNSLYGSASFSYNDMVYLDLTARNDWSSTLPAENRSYFYSSASVSVLLNEMFNLQGSNIDLLKLKASTASVGNDTDAQQIVNVFKVAANGYLGNTQITRQNIHFSESLKPEDVTSNEIGFEFKAFRNRLYADFAYYNISSKNLIFDVPVDPGTGYDYFRENVGEITNKGFEFLIGGTPVSNETFSWDVSVNMAKNKNSLESLIDGQDNFTFSSSNNGIVDVRAEVGGGYGDIYATDWLRTDDGQLLLTAEGRPQATSERVKVGNYQPDFTGGFTNTFRYKDFTLNTLIDFRVGGEVYSATDAGLDASGVSKKSLQYREGGVVVDGVIEDGNGGYMPNTENISAQEYWGAVSSIGSEYVFSQTNVRLRELSLTYNMPAKFLDHTFLTAVSVSAVGRNLFFIYKEADNFDPESSYSTSNLGQGVLFYALPTTRSIGLSLNVKF
ncbi:SusC/RagA family TonB-linked outer membrane protein [Galbibacter pacificus]|uniref:SusC/RagA family TonB-linked outer membrane protein n=1 Tax=Galbibacter pacificus TaxID=2996052 RepID=A0ABT6FT62_9FLAO|nr:SusC/RagA family TonB-linked outer membrane protein [Galbibacter pacificus]MDG3582423.1 SusC/RagA family TonB-linked outer membrane protein [Galbibacter pacificus]MDG3586459.1 SusC/RagA family TonB-linked outer membrane protein [Galbibacter pacificus]